MCASLIDDEFFDRKRPWSRIKDQVIGSYMPPYLAKVAKLPNRIVLIDAFAGPGIYDGEIGPAPLGSPLIMCQEAEKYAKGKYTAIFCNHRKEQHERLSAALEERGGLVSSKTAIPLLGNNEDLLRSIHQVLTNQTVLLYLDPFGLKGCEFDTIRPFLERSKQYSTELIVNISAPIMHRLAARSAVGSENAASQVEAFHKRLTEVLGGDWWKPILWNDTMTPSQRAMSVIIRYVAQLKDFMPFAGYCPVREREQSTLKYFITFCSRRIDSLLLLNDIMCKAYNEHIVSAEYVGTLFEGTVDWRDNRPLEILDRIIMDTVQPLNQKGQRPSRVEVWARLLSVPNNFMQFTSAEYRGRVRELCKAGRLNYVDVRGTGKLNDDSLLYTA